MHVAGVVYFCSAILVIVGTVANIVLNWLSKEHESSQRKCPVVQLHYTHYRAGPFLFFSCRGNRVNQGLNERMFKSIQNVIQYIPIRYTFLLTNIVIRIYKYRKLCVLHTKNLTISSSSSSRPLCLLLTTSSFFLLKYGAAGMYSVWYKVQSTRSCLYVTYKTCALYFFFCHLYS